MLLTVTLLAGVAAPCSAESLKYPEDSPILQTLLETPSWLNENNASALIETGDIPPICTPECPGQWWDGFKDEALNTLLKEGLAKNKEITIARATLAEARGKLRSSVADELPDVSLGATWSRQRNVYQNSSSGNNSGSGSNGFQIFQPNITSKVFSAPLRVAYDADIWLKNRDNSRAEKRRLDSETEQLRQVQLTVVTDIASAYFQYKASHDLLSLFTAALDVAKADLRAAEAQVTYGLKTPDVAAAKTKQLALLESQLATFRQLNHTSESQLAVLTGQLPSQLREQALLRPSHLTDIPLRSVHVNDAPAALIFQRPDLRSLSLELEAANIDVRVARKAFLPSLNLAAQLGYTDISVGSFTLESLAWNAIANLAQTVFTGGKRRADVKIAKAKREKAFYEFEKQLLLASKEVDDALSGLKNSAASLQQQKRIDDATAKQDAIQKARMEAGAIAKNVYYAQSLQTLEAKANVIQHHLGVLTSELSLYKALGGGF